MNKLSLDHLLLLIGLEDYPYPAKALQSDLGLGCLSLNRFALMVL